MSDNQVGEVFESTPNFIIVIIKTHEVFDKHKIDLQIGKYLKIQQGNNDFIVAQIQNVKSGQYPILDHQNICFYLSTRPIGMIDNEGNFSRGSIILPVPTEPVFLLSDKSTEKIYFQNKDMNYYLGRLLHNKTTKYYLNGNRFFSKHIAIVGSTGSGKSCAVARIIQNAIGINKNKNENLQEQKNSHIIIFDIHSEYAHAFNLPSDEKFNLNLLNVDNLALPYWLMNADELESLFIESQEQNSHNQISIFKQAVIKNKEKHNSGMHITYDTPAFFDINEVVNYIKNMNNEVLSKLTDSMNQPKLSNGSFIDRKSYFDEEYDFAENSSARADKASSGPFKGEFDRFILRLETRLNDKRLSFLLDPQKGDEAKYSTSDFSSIVQQFIGYINKSNVSVIDLSGIPFEVLSIVISLVSRIVFDFCFHYSKLRHAKDEKNDIPILLVCEEAHNYVPRSGGAEYNASRHSIERIAKEGRKYGISLMIVSQRPSEVSETIFAQCNNFIALRLNNDNDQSYIKSLLPENDSGVADILPNLGLGEALVVGDAALLPSLVKLEKPEPEPKSESIEVYDEWLCSWKTPTFDDVIERWRKW